MTGHCPAKASLPINHNAASQYSGLPRYSDLIRHQLFQQGATIFAYFESTTPKRRQISPNTPRPSGVLRLMRRVGRCQAAATGQG
jgi:hypothetical protein